MDKAARAALLTAKGMDKTSENIADYVADLLRQGRAKEITDDLMEQADPQRLHHHYTTGNTGMDMPMDQASRMARAREMYESAAKRARDEEFSSAVGLRTDTKPDGWTRPSRVWKEGVPTKKRLNGVSTTQLSSYENNDKAFSQHGLGEKPRNGWGYAFDPKRKFLSLMYGDTSEAGEDNLESVIPDAKSMLTRDRTTARFDPRLDHLAHLNASAGGAMEFARHVEAVHRAGGQIAPSKYLPNVPRAVHAGGGKVAFQEGNHPDVPEVVYHGTQSDIKTFRQSQTGEFGPGIYMTDLPEEASDYAGTHPFAGKGPNVMPLHLSMKNPFVVKSDPQEFWKKFGGKWDEDAQKNAIAAGHDGVIFRRPYMKWDDSLKREVPTGKHHTHFVAFNPTQVKSAISAQNFDPNDPNITKSGGGEVVNLGKEKLVRSITKAASDVKSGAHQERMDQRAHKLHESGHLPLPIGTKVTPPQGWDMPSELHIHGYWQDILHPEQHGYKLKSENGDLYEVQHQMHSGQNPYVFGGGFKAYSGPVRNRAGYSDEAMASRNPILPTRTPEQSDQLNKEYDQLFGTEPDMTKAEGGEVDDDGITAYHGSAYDFPQFDISKLGTGTGHQAKGHGLYFAGDENDAKNYREMLKNNGSIDIEHESHKLGIPLDRDAQADLRSVSRNVNGDSTLAAKALQARNLAARAMPQEKLADLIDRHRKSTTGHMYKVKLNVKPEELLDWDKPLSEQHPNVQAALSRTMPDYTIKNMAGMPHAFANGKMIEVNPNGLTGRDAYVLSRMGKSTEGSSTHQDAKAASEHLLSEGIKGIRYRETGTHNYVMFHHDPVQVVDKYEYGGTVGKAEGGRGNGDFEVGKKYNGVIPQIKYLPVHAIERQPSEHEVSRVSDDVAKNMDFSEPVDATAFRYSSNHSEDHPSVALQNGHHRLAAARQTGRPHLPVTLTAVNAKGEKLNALKALSDEIERSMITKADGGAVDAALALTRRFTKDGIGATLALKTKGK